MNIEEVPEVCQNAKWHYVFFAYLDGKKVYV